MSKGGKVKISKIKSKLFDTECFEHILQQISGQDDENSLHNISIIYEQYDKYEGTLKTFVCTSIRFAYIFKQYNTLKKFYNNLLNMNGYLIGEQKRLFSFDRSKLHKVDVIMSEPQNLVELKSHYKNLKQSQLIQVYITICANLVRNGLHQCTSPEQVLKMVKNGTLTTIEPFANINQYNIKDETGTDVFKNLNYIYLLDNKCPLEHGTKLLIAEYLIELFNTSKHIHELYSSPDIDIDQIFPMIIDQLKMFSKELKGCKNAIKIIENSSELFKNNFSSYYKGFVQSNNPMSIAENFLQDVLEDVSDDTNMNTVFELRKLIAFIKRKINNKMSKSGMEPPKMVSEMLDKVESAFNDFNDILTKKESYSKEELQTKQNEIIGVFGVNFTELSNEIQQMNMTTTTTTTSTTNTGIPDDINSEDDSESE